MDLVSGSGEEAIPHTLVDIGVEAIHSHSAGASLGCHDGGGLTPTMEAGWVLAIRSGVTR